MCCSCWLVVARCLGGLACIVLPVLLLVIIVLSLILFMTCIGFWFVRLFNLWCLCCRFGAFVWLLFYWVWCICYLQVCSVCVSVLFTVILCLFVWLWLFTSMWFLLCLFDVCLFVCFVGLWCLACWFGYGLLLFCVFCSFVLVI